MPTISQLPAASSVSAADEVPISQNGSAVAASVGVLLASAQPAIIVDSPSLLGRISLGSGGPEQVDVGIGISLSSGTLVADGLDHSIFPAVSSLSVESDLVISNQGSPMLMQASLLRGLFSPGQNVTIDSNGTISTAVEATTTGTVVSGSSIGELQVVSGLVAQDLVAVSHAGSDYAIAYSNFLDGITIDQAQAAEPASNSDTIWVAQGSNVMTSQTFSAIWVWIANNLPTYKTPVVEITTSTNLDTTVHNGRILVCSQPVTLTHLTNNMGSGFRCTVINASTGNITLGSGFVTSNGSFILTPWQSATLCCGTYSAGTIAFAAMPTAASATAVTPIPGQVSGLSTSGATTTTITVAWQSPSTGGAVASYVVQFRPTGTTSWTSSVPIIGAATYELTALEAATSYDFSVIGVNSVGAGLASATVTAETLAASGSVSSISFNLLPSGTYTHASGAIGINALISPAASPVQFGFSLSTTTPPSSWTAATLVNNTLWGAYVPTPATTGTWYTWGEGLDGSARTVSPSSFLVQ
jgi:hypothetical protein